MTIISKMSKKIMFFVKEHIGEISQDDFEIAQYGIEVFLLNLYKAPIIFGIAYCLGIFKYCFFVFLLFGTLRNYTWGIHMKNGFTCTLCTCISFFSIVFLSIECTFSFYTKIILALVALYALYIYAPADTEERPCLNEKRREKNKKISLLLGGLYSLFSILYSNPIIGNFFLFTLLWASMMILPITYKLFNRRYNNYVYYEENENPLI